MAWLVWLDRWDTATGEQVFEADFPGLGPVEVACPLQPFPFGQRFHRKGEGFPVRRDAPVSPVRPQQDVIDEAVGVAPQKVVKGIVEEFSHRALRNTQSLQTFSLRSFQ